MAGNAYIVLDLETGGLDENVNPITQLAFIALDSKGRRLKNQMNKMIKPYNDLKIEKAATKVTGLTPQKLEKEGEDIKDVLKEFVLHLKELNPKIGTKGAKFCKPVIVGHNIQFDIDFLLENLGNILDVYLYDYIDDAPIDTLRLGRMAYPEMSTHKLGILCKQMGIQLTDAHDAMSDVKATSKVFVELMNRLKNDSKTGSKEEVLEYHF